MTLLVVAHHAALAYHPYAASSTSLDAVPRLWPAFPVVDAQRWSGFHRFVSFNDVFFMPLMFFLSGLFVWNSLRRKGGRRFVADRTLRLGVPFLAGAALAPLAYYPAYLLMEATPSPGAFARQWLSLGGWPTGPAWFLWVLLTFGLLAAGVFAVAPRWGDTLGRWTARRSPVALFGALLAASALGYLPMALTIGPATWMTVGPFSVQTSRVFLYATYFVAGIAVGVQGLDQGLLKPRGALARRWPAWIVLAASAFGLVVLLDREHAINVSPALGAAVSGLAFVLSCAASGFALLALFLRFANTSPDRLESLRANAYGIYIVHYVFVVWMQYVWLGASLSGLAKGTLVFVTALGLSWATTATLRRIPAVGRVI